MTSDQSVDRHLRVVYDGLVTTINVTKQLVWSAPPALNDQLRDLLAFLIDQCRLVDEAEARIDGRAPSMAAPSSYERPNLVGEFDNDVHAALAAYVNEVTDLASDIRSRASDMGDVDEATLLVETAEGLEQRVSRLEIS